MHKKDGKNDVNFKKISVKKLSGKKRVKESDCFNGDGFVIKPVENAYIEEEDCGENKGSFHHSFADEVEKEERFDNILKRKITWSDINFDPIPYDIWNVKDI